MNSLPDVYTLTNMLLKMSLFAASINDEPLCRRPDISRATALLDWVPVVPVQQGIQATIDWFAGRQDGAEVLQTGDNNRSPPRLRSPGSVIRN